MNTPPSVNSKTPFDLDIEIPEGKYYRVDIVVNPLIANGDVDNRIRPVLSALAKRGLKEEKVVYVSCRFGAENKVDVIPVEARSCN